MPAAIKDRAIDADIGRPGGGKNFLSPRNAVFEHSRTVLADRIVDTRRRDAMAVPEDGIKRDAVMLLRQALADRRQAEPVAIKPAERGVVARPPRQQSLGLAGNGLRHRSDAAAELKGVATHETARWIGFVELLAPETGRRRAVAVGRLVYVAVGLRIGMEHQVLADQSAGIGKPVRKASGGRIQEQPRRADAVTGDHNDFGGLKLLDAILVVIHDAGCHALLIGGDLAHPAMRAKLGAGAQRHRPVGDVGARLCALRACRRAMAEIDASRPRNRRLPPWYRTATSASRACSLPSPDGS